MKVWREGDESPGDLIVKTQNQESKDSSSVSSEGIKCAELERASFAGQR